jgi:tartrate-resistant acid phosphatase type 5
VQNSQDLPRITRRHAIKKTVLFSTTLLAAGWLRAEPKKPKTDFRKGMHFLAMGDFGSGNANQRAVAAQMAAFAKKLDAPLNAVLALGDNFYGQLTPERFQPHFEEMYPQADFDCPFYACLGNHDYGPKYDSNQGRVKAQMQLDYAAANPNSRWKMPAKWYSLELPDAKKPLVKMIVLDGNLFEGALTPKEKLEQKRFLEAELQKKTKAPWQWMISHYPLFTTTTKRTDNTRLINDWGGHLQNHPFSLYLAGHDHNLQHLKATGYKNNFIVSGAGGAHLYEVTPSDRGFTQAVHGFNHLHVTSDKVTVQYIDVEGRCLHGFERSVKGKTKIIC